MACTGDMRNVSDFKLECLKSGRHFGDLGAEERITLIRNKYPSL
jgi:hypothetical protein